MPRCSGCFLMDRASSRCVVGIDVGGHDTDEKIPVEEFLRDIDGFLEGGVQTDGSSVVLPKIAALNNGSETETFLDPMGIGQQLP